MVELEKLEKATKSSESDQGCLVKSITTRVHWSISGHQAATEKLIILYMVGMLRLYQVMLMNLCPFARL